MKCYYHHDRDALGTCKSCGRGLCEECHVVVGRGLACRNQCEGDVRALNYLIESNMRQTPTGSTIVAMAKRSGVISALFFLLLGISMFAFGINDFVDHGTVDMRVFMGGIAIVYGLVGLWRVKQMPAPNRYPPGHCRKCGYDLTGNESGTCPECGDPGHSP